MNADAQTRSEVLQSFAAPPTSTRSCKAGRSAPGLSPRAVRTRFSSSHPKRLN